MGTVAILLLHHTRYKQMATTKAKAATPAAKPVQVQYVSLTGSNPVKPYRNNSARALYWQSLQQQCKAAPSGKLPYATLATLWGSAQTAPQLPKSGKVEPPAGWVSYFVRMGLATVGTMQAVPTA